MASPEPIAILADDDETFRMAMTALLKGRCGFADVIETSSLDEALAHLGADHVKSPITLALFDLEMPGMTGAACLSAVRECFPQVRVVVVTGSTRRRDVLLALEAGVHGYISKDIGIKELARAIDLILQDIIFVPGWLADAPPSAQLSALRPDAGPQKAAASEPPTDARLNSAPKLTPRQHDVLQLIVAGQTNKEIARELDLGEGTVKIHVAALLRAFKAATRSGVASSGARMLAADHSVFGVSANED